MFIIGKLLEMKGFIMAHVPFRDRHILIIIAIYYFYYYCYNNYYYYFTRLSLFCERVFFCFCAFSRFLHFLPIYNIEQEPFFFFPDVTLAENDSTHNVVSVMIYF